MIFWIFILLLAIASNFIYRNFILPTIPLIRKSPNDKAKYEIKKMKAPIVTGKLLTFLMHLTEVPIIGDILINKIKKDSGFDALWKLDVDDYPGTLQCITIPDKRNKKNQEINKETEKIDQDKYFQENNKGFKPQTIDTYIDAYKKKSTDPVKVVKQIIEKAKLLQQEYKMNSIAQINDEDALRQAEVSKKHLEEGNPRSKFEGIPIMVKEELLMKGYKFSVGTKFLSSNENSEDCVVVERLKKSGFIVVGLTSMFEIGISPSGLNVNRGPCKNPYDLTRDSGGSSSGSCSVVASGLVPCSIGCDGGGSIRVPASHCGLVGLKATHSRVPEKGVYPLCFSVGHAGPIAWNVKDVFSIYQVIAGEHEEEIFSLYQPKPDPVLYPNFDIFQSNSPLQNIRIGVYNEWTKDCDTEVFRAFQNGLNVLKKYGGKIVDIEIPLLEELRLAHITTITSEMNSVMIPKDQFRHLHGENVRLSLNITRNFTASEYIQAQKIRTCCSLIFKKIFEDVDVIVTPTCGIVAPPYPKDCSTGEVNSESLSYVMRYVFPGNTLGFPAITVPVGYNSDKLPIGFQIFSNLWDENTSIYVSTFIEKELERISPKIYTNII